MAAVRETQNAKRVWRPRLVLGGLCLVGAALGTVQTMFAQDGVTEQTALSGNNATIVVSVRSVSGEPLPVGAAVKLYRSGSIPNGQATTSSGGRAILVPQNLGAFLVVVEAPGYKPARANVDVPIPVRVEVDVYMQPDGSIGEPSAAPGGNLILAPKAKELLEKGLEALRASHLEEAEKLLSEAAKLAPGHPDVLYLQGVLYMRQGEWAKAQAVLERATQKDTSHARAQAALGTALCNQGKYGQGIAPLERAVELNGQSWETRWTLAKAYYEQKKYEPALKESQAALAGSDGKAPEIELLVAQALTAVGRYEDSADALRSFLKNHAEHAEAPRAKRWLERLAAAGKIKGS